MATSDAPSANEDDLSSQLGYIMIFTEDSGRGIIISYASLKSKHVVRSVLGAETYAFADSFDQVYAICEELLTIMCQKIPLIMLTDFACLFNVIIWSFKTSKCRSMMDLAATRDAYDKREIDDIG